jgi:hypothetical protein
MKPASTTIALLIGLLAATSFAQEPAPEFITPQKEHEWLKQFEGEWITEGEAIMAPGQEPIHCTGTMKSAMLGDFWIMSEISTKVQADTMRGVQTIGYDPQQKKYVGTWVDSMMNHMWKYEGTVDATGKQLTLEAEGPNFMLGGKMTQFRDAYEFKTPDHIVATSSMLGDDGKWITFMTGNYKRKK